MQCDLVEPLPSNICSAAGDDARAVTVDALFVKRLIVSVLGGLAGDGAAGTEAVAAAVSYWKDGIARQCSVETVKDTTGGTLALPAP